MQKTEEYEYINAHINNISFPKGIEELETFVYEHGMYNVEEVLNCSEVFWTVPRSSKIGDIVLFYHAKTAISRISALTSEVKALPDESIHPKALLLDWLGRARGLYGAYGGKIFAVARIVGSPEHSEMRGSTGVEYHWHGRVYASVADIAALDVPVDISEFNSFIKVSRQSAITPLPSTEFNKLRSVIRSRNCNLPDYFLNCRIGTNSLSRVNCENFLLQTSPYRRRFLLETDFRSYYVDYLLKSLSGRQVWSECRCQATGKADCFVDNVFCVNDRHYLLEVKLNTKIEKNLSRQLQQYIRAERIFLKQGEPKAITDFEKAYIYVIDTDAFFRYEAETDCLIELVKLDALTSVDQIKRLL